MSLRPLKVDIARAPGADYAHQQGNKTLHFKEKKCLLKLRQKMKTPQFLSPPPPPPRNSLDQTWPCKKPLSRTPKHVGPLTGSLGPHSWYDQIRWAGVLPEAASKTKKVHVFFRFGAVLRTAVFSMHAPTIEGTKGTRG